MRNLTGSLLVGFDFSNKGTGVLIIGTPDGKGGTDIINAFKGEEAWELYQKLITQPNKK